MKQKVVALFGEAERGDYQAAALCRNLCELLHRCGHPPPGSLGLHFAIQTILYERNLLFFRVREEGFSRDDYFYGFHFLNKAKDNLEVDAVLMPGVGERELLDEAVVLCRDFNTPLIMSVPDLYDFLTFA